MSAIAAALLICCGALILTWALSTPGDQTAASFIGGCLIGCGLSLLVGRAMS